MKTLKLKWERQHLQTHEAVVGTMTCRTRYLKGARKWVWLVFHTMSWDLLASGYSRSRNMAQQHCRRAVRKEMDADAQLRAMQK